MDRVASTRVMINAHTILRENLQERDHLYDLGIGGKIIQALKRKEKGLDINMIHKTQGRFQWCTYDHDNQNMFSLKRKLFLQRLSNYKVFKDSPPCS